MTFDYKKPTVNFDTVTDEERRVAELYTRIRPTAVKGEPDAHTAWLVVGNQHFCISDYYENAKHASWSCWMVAKALLNFKMTEAGL